MTRRTTMPTRPKEEIERLATFLHQPEPAFERPKILRGGGVVELGRLGIGRERLLRKVRLLVGGPEIAVDVASEFAVQMRVLAGFGDYRGNRRNRRGPASGPRTQRLHLQQSRGRLREGELSSEGARGLYQGGRARQRRRLEESSGAKKQARAGEEKSLA